MASLVQQGRVAVNGEPASSFNQPVDAGRDRIQIDGRDIDAAREKRVYLLLNKPAGILSTTRDERGRPTVIDYVPEKLRHYKIYPVGRLDKESTGLVLLTNDGQLAYRLTHPSFGYEKEYRVRLDRELSSADRLRIEQGVLLDDGITSPARVKDLSGQEEFVYDLVIHEGKKHIIRRMLAWLGYRVVQLERTRLGGLLLGDLPAGKIRVLTSSELESLKKNTAANQRG
jgi:23S rRNA pseudouridine2605 synthase